MHAGRACRMLVCAWRMPLACSVCGLLQQSVRRSVISGEDQNVSGINLNREIQQSEYTVVSSYSHSLPVFTPLLMLLLISNALSY